jgi:hypothetical protein
VLNTAWSGTLPFPSTAEAKLLELLLILLPASKNYQQNLLEKNSAACIG